MYIGLDLGTSGIRAVLMDDGQTIIASSEAIYDVDRPKLGWSEQNPLDWIEGCKKVLRQLHSDHCDLMSNVLAISISGHMHGATLLNAKDDVLRPCILWNDTRSHVEAKAFDENPIFRKLSGNIVFPGFTAPKLAWVKNNEPDIFSKIAKVLLPKDFLRLWLTGGHVSEMSDAAGTSLLDVEKRDWSPELLSASGMTLDQMPSLVEGSDESGQLRLELATEFGMKSGVIIAGGGGDNAASACGIGATGEGEAFVSLGTSGVLFAANDAYRPDPDSAVHTFCHALPDMWHQMGVILSATDSLNWLSSITGKKPAELTSSLGSGLKSPNDVKFLPYLSGERTPHNDSNIRGSFSNIDISATSKDLAQSVIEGVSFALRDNLEALRQAGTELNKIIAVGGGSRSDYWLSLLATVLDKPIALPEKGDFGAAFGAARLAQASVSKQPIQDIMAIPKIAREFEPQRHMTQEFEDAYQTYRALYPALKGV
jgi:xylulokinase